MELELLRKVFEDDAVHLALATVIKLEYASDMTALFARCQLCSEDRKVTAQVGWAATGDKAGIYMEPEANDLVILAFTDDEDHAFVLARLSSSEEKIPAQVKQGHAYIKARAGKKTFVASDTKVEIGKGVNPATEPLVLGAVLITMLGQVITKFQAAVTAIKTGPIGIGNLGAPVPTDPALVIALTQVNDDLDAIVQQFLTAAGTNIVSQIGFTERGN